VAKAGGVKAALGHADIRALQLGHADKCLSVWYKFYLNEYNFEGYQ
jgi:hypothetical protein